jgi:hypothetical protein
MAGKRTRRRSSGGVPLWVWLAIGGGAIALVVVIAVALVVVLGRDRAGAGTPGGGLPGGGLPGASKKVAWNDFVALRKGMTADQVQGMIGLPVESRQEREGTVMTWEGKVGGDYIELTFRDGRLAEGFGFYGGTRSGVNE